MALSENEKKVLDSWFSPATRASEAAWAEKLNEVTPIYQEMGFTRGEGAILFMLSQLLTQAGLIANIVKRWDEEDDDEDST